MSIVGCSSIACLVESDYSYHGNFHKYCSYKFASNVSFSGTEAEKDVVDNYMKSTLTSWGYDRSDKRPDLPIFSQVYYDDLMSQGFQQPKFQSWLKHNFSDKETVFKQDTLLECLEKIRKKR